MRTLSPLIGLLCLLFVLPDPAVAGHPKGLKLPMGMQLNGRFDVLYERTGYSDDPSDGVNAIRNDHHFIFLSRNGGKKDPMSFTVELVDLSFYEIGASWRPTDRWRLSARTGKILVPFGAEPLFHHDYGGLSGFDQPTLPTVWARHGLAGQFSVRLGPMRISNDIYAVHGHTLKEADQVLDLKTDFSRPEDARIALGDRLGLGWGPLSLWYSVYFNKLGHDRTLLLQALDLKFWRYPDVPFLEDLSVSVGAMRADVSGGGKGKDYYHLATYLTVRYAPLDWLTVQYRSGLTTVNNRRGFIVDDTRLDEKDRSTHNVGVIFGWKGLTLGLYTFFNLEKNNEQDNDLLRVSLAYDF